MRKRGNKLLSAYNLPEFVQVSIKVGLFVFAESCRGGQYVLYHALSAVSDRDDLPAATGHPAGLVHQQINAERRSCDCDVQTPSRLRNLAHLHLRLSAPGCIVSKKGRKQHVTFAPSLGVNGILVERRLNGISIERRRFNLYWLRAVVAAITATAAAEEVWHLLFKKYSFLLLENSTRE